MVDPGFRTEEIMSGMLSQTGQQVGDLGDKVLKAHKEMVGAARKFIGTLYQLDGEGYSCKPKEGSTAGPQLIRMSGDEHLQLKNAVGIALSVEAAELERAGPSYDEKTRVYDILRTVALSHGLTEKAEEITRIIAGLNGTEHPEYQERDGLAIRI